MNEDQITLILLIVILILIRVWIFIRGASIFAGWAFLFLLYPSGYSVQPIHAKQVGITFMKRVGVGCVQGEGVGILVF
jgi:hypothetical protein